MLNPCSLQVSVRYRERKAISGKKKKIFRLRKAEGSNLKMEEISRMGSKKHRQYGNPVREESDCSKVVLNVC